MPKSNAVNRFACELTIRELWVALESHAPAAILGMPDPFLGLEADARRWCREQAESSLLRRGADPRLKAACADIAHPVHMLVLAITDAGCPSRTIYAFIGERQAALVQLSSRSEILLEGLPDALALERELALRLCNEANEADEKASGACFSVPEDEFFRLHAEWRNRREADGSPLPGGLAPGPTHPLSDLFAEAESNFAVAALRHCADPARRTTDGFALLRGHGRAWMIQPRIAQDTRFTDVTPADGEIIRARLHSLME